MAFSSGGEDASENGTLRIQAQFKFFTMIEQLQKLKFGTGENVKKGFVEGSEKLWLSVANAKIHNLIKGVD